VQLQRAIAWRQVEMLRAGRVFNGGRKVTHDGKERAIRIKPM
jgi:hypothetical protein